MSNVKFIMNISSGADILKNNPGISSMQSEAMHSMLPIIEAQFFQDFGFEGKFEINSYISDRQSVKISAADKKTGSILKKNPRWLDMFINNITI